MIYPATAWPFLTEHPFNKGKAPNELQLRALDFGVPREKCGYWLEQGLAKTVTDLAHQVYNVQHDDIDAAIVIAPPYLKSGWEDEASMWGYPFPVITWPDRIEPQVAKKPHLFVINYEATAEDYQGGKYLEELLAARRYSMTLDESPAIKNMGGAISKRIRYVGQGAKYRRTLTGTPMTQSVMDLYPQLRFMGELNGMNPYQFKYRYGKTGGFKGKVVVGFNEDNIGELQNLIDSVAFRALKRDWWKDAPEKIYEPPREIEMTPRQLAAYRSMLLEFHTMIGPDHMILASQVVHMKSKLLQISRGFIIDTENESKVEVLVPPDKNPALRVLKGTIETIPGKWIVFTTRTYSTNMLEEQLKKYGIVTMRGGMNKAEVAAIKFKFNNDPECRGMVAMSSVGARGHTLLGTEIDRCSTSIYWENDYNLETRLQSEDRNHRRGQDRNVSYIDFFCSPEDKVVVQALQRKTDLVEAIVNAVRQYPNA